MFAWRFAGSRAPVEGMLEVQRAEFLVALEALHQPTFLGHPRL